MKFLGLSVALVSLLSSNSFALDLGDQAAKECTPFAIDNAVKVEQSQWGTQVAVLHFDRAISIGLSEGTTRYDTQGLANIEVTLSRESTDPVVYEMVVTGVPVRGSSQLKCTVTKTKRRDLLQ